MHGVTMKIKNKKCNSFASLCPFRKSRDTL